MKPKLECIIFSKDRAFQLEACLNTFFHYCEDADLCKINILYSAGTNVFERQYDNIRTRFNQCEFNESYDFALTLKEIISDSTNTYVLILPEINLFYDYFKLEDIISVLDKEQSIQGFSFLDGENIKTPLDDQKLFDKYDDHFLSFTLNDKIPADTNNFPFSVFRINELKAILDKVKDIDNIYKIFLESKRNSQSNLPKLLCYSNSKAICINLSNDTSKNENLSSYPSTDEMVELFNEGLRFKINTMLNIEVRSKLFEFSFVNYESFRQEPILSVIISCYNHDKFIADAIEGVLLQKTNFYFEFIIGEDLSTDNSREICLQYKRKFPKFINLVLNKKNLGMNKNMVQLFNMSRGKYATLLDSDDYWTDADKLQKQVDFLENNPDFTVTHHNAVFSDETKGSKYLAFDKNKKSITNLEELALANHIVALTSVFKKRVDDTLINMLLETPFLDYTFHIYNSQFGKIKYFEDIMGVYRIHTAGMWSSLTDKVNAKKNIKCLQIVLNYLKMDLNIELNFIAQYFRHLKQLLIEITKENNITEFKESIINESYFLKNIITNNTLKLEHINDFCNSLLDIPIKNFNELLSTMVNELSIEALRDILLIFSLNHPKIESVILSKLISLSERGEFNEAFNLAVIILQNNISQNSYKAIIDLLNKSNNFIFKYFDNNDREIFFKSLINNLINNQNTFQNGTNDKLLSNYEGIISNSSLLHYDKYFNCLKSKHVSVFTIGNTDKLPFWDDYFLFADIIGLNPDFSGAFKYKDSIKVYRGSPLNTEMLKAIIERHASNGFDVIIDDASHIAEATKTAFDYLFYNHLKPGGIYVIEAWGTGYWGNWPDGAYYVNGKNHQAGMVGFVKSLIDVLALEDITKPGLGIKPELNSSINSIEFFFGQVFITKKELL